MRQAARRDESEKAIIEALLANGWSVQQISARDVPDLLIGKNGRTYLAEVKTGSGKLRPGQIRWHGQWKGKAVLVLRTVTDALEVRTS